MRTVFFSRRTKATAAQEPRRRPTRTVVAAEREPANLRELTADVFAAVFAFRAAPPAAYAAFRREIEQLLNLFVQRSERTGADPDGDVLLAMVALIDETAMRTAWAGAREWARDTLALRYLQSEDVGHRFFDRLEDFLRARTGAEMLEVYYLCLVAGLTGEYRNDPDALEAYRAKLLGRIPTFDVQREAHLTDEAYGRPLERPLVLRRFPVFWALPFVLGAIGFYIAWYVTLNQQVAHIRDLPRPAASTSPN